MSEKKKAFLRTLPKKRMAAGALIQNQSGEILLLKPSYKPVWEIPGGVVEAQESPLAACRREILEEIGIEVPIRQLLCVDYLWENEQRTEDINFVFWGGELSPEEIARIRIDQKEIIDFTFFKPEEIVGKTATTLGRRIGKCLESLSKGQTFYLEDQELQDM